MSSGLFLHLTNSTHNIIYSTFDGNREPWAFPTCTSDWSPCSKSRNAPLYILEGPGYPLMAKANETLLTQPSRNFSPGRSTTYDEYEQLSASVTDCFILRSPLHHDTRHLIYRKLYRIPEQSLSRGSVRSKNRTRLMTEPFYHQFQTGHDFVLNSEVQCVYLPMIHAEPSAASSTVHIRMSISLPKTMCPHCRVNSFACQFQ
ncbi:hypothetical protein BJX64DRAFT_205890 [Aspergillus heterothallicus]